jgi:SAM-dependent methyltransferase
VSRPRPASGGWQAELLRRVFLHQNGMAAASALATLESAGVLRRLRQGSAPAAELAATTSSPLVVAASLAAACGAGWLAAQDDGTCSLAPGVAAPGRAVALATVLELHRAVREAVRDADWSSDSVVSRLLGCVSALASAKAVIRGQTSMPDAETARNARLLEGILAVPLLPRVATGYDQAALAPFLDALEFADGQVSLRQVLSFFAPMYGLAGSYSAALLRLPDLVADTAVSPADITTSVDRGLNVRASAAAHQGYFQAASKRVLRLFDQMPLSRQPEAIVDVGCGAGTWLRSLYLAICQSTARGRSLRQYPLHLIGVDTDPVALDIGRRTLDGLPATCVPGDVGQPAALAEAVASASGTDLGNALSVRAFVDHNRSLPALEPAGARCPGTAEGVYGTASGSVVSADAVYRDWSTHYAGWREICGRHGLVVIEAHTLPAAEVRARLETSHALALQYYHALSGQSIIPYPRFRAAASSAGLDSPDPVLYPPPSPTTSVSRLVPAGAGGSGA